MRARNDGVIGNSVALTAALDHLSLLATIDRPVLVLGERGTGKELAAGRLHFLSPRWDAPFLKVNCAAMAESLLESELFGHESGAFTGATRQHVGRFERADGGTLLLDEIATMSARLQEKLLRVIEYGEFERLGGQKTLTVDVRVIGATHADLQALTSAGRFRADLLDRLSFDVVHLPPLRHRGDDVLLLAEHFALQLCGELGWPLFPGFTREAENTLRHHPWPGNIRELKNAVERSLFRAGSADEPLHELFLDPFANPYDDGKAAPTGPEQHGASAGAYCRPPSATLPTDLRAAVARIRARAAADGVGALLVTIRRQCADALGLTYNQMRGLVRKHGFTTRPPRKDSPQ
jgi:psp operon transcriptional activator